jgi:hypothetical protein
MMMEMDRRARCSAAAVSISHYIGAAIGCLSRRAEYHSSVLSLYVPPPAQEKSTIATEVTTVLFFSNNG